MTDLIPSMHTTHATHATHALHADATAPGRGSGSADLSSESIRSQKFDTSFRGYDTGQVRQFLSRVGVHVSNLHDQVAGLSLELDSARSVRPVIDLTTPAGATVHTSEAHADATVELIVADEASAVAAAQLIDDARREAKLIIDRANSEAGRILLRARAESRGKQRDGRGVEPEGDHLMGHVSTGMLADGPVGLGDTDVETDAVTAEAAREQARAMIGEARAVRERILTDLAKRRRTAHVQLEQLRVGREKLLETMREARRVVDVATGDLQHAETEARLAGEAAGRRVSEEPMPTADQLGAELTGGRHLSSLRHVSSSRAEQQNESDFVPEPRADESARKIVPVATTVSFPDDADHDEVPTVELRLSDLVTTQDLLTETSVEPAVLAAEAVLPEDAETVEVEQVEVALVEIIPVEFIPVEIDSVEFVSVEIDSLGALVHDVALVAVITAEGPPTPALEMDPVVEAQRTDAQRTDDQRTNDQPTDDQLTDELHLEPPVAQSAGPVVRKRSAGAAFAKLRAEHPGAGSIVPQGSRPASAGESAAAIPAQRRQAKRASSAAAGVAATALPPVVPLRVADVHEPETVVGVSGSPAVSSAAAVDVAATVLERRSAELELLQLRVTRRLKRQLQDDHSAALSSVRRTRGHATAATLLGDPAVSLTRLVAVLESGTDEACESGRRSMAMLLGTPVNDHRLASAATPLTVAQQLAQQILTEITEAVETGLADGSSEYATVLGVAFRDWSTERIGREVTASLSNAFGIGAAGQIEPGTPVTWVVEHGDDPSPDCDDNSLAGSIRLGHTFPTGHALPPLGAGCRCIVVPTAG